MTSCELCCGECKNEKQIRVSFCPKCKSRDVKYIFEMRNLFGVLPKMRCGKCGYEMTNFPLIITNKKELSKIKPKIKKEKKNDTRR